MRTPTDPRRLLSAALALGFLAPPALAAPPEGCTKGPAEAIRSGDHEAAEDALRRALADSACTAVAPELRLRLAQVLGDNHGGKPGPACEAMGLFRRIAAESSDPLVQSDAAARADRLTPVCAGEAPKDGAAKTAPGPETPAVEAGQGAETETPGLTADAPPPREPGTTEWALVGGGGAMMAVGAVLIGLSIGKLEDRDAANRAYLAAPFGSAEEADAAQRFEDEQTTAQVLVGTGLAAVGIGAALAITAVAMWPGSAEPDPEPTARLMVGPGGVGLVGRW